MPECGAGGESGAETKEKNLSWRRVEYEGQVLDIEKAMRAVRGDFGVWGELEDILDMVVVYEEEG